MTKVKIKQFKNKKKEPVAGLTPEHAIYDSNGIRLDAKLGNVNLQEFRDLQQQSVNNIKQQQDTTEAYIDNKVVSAKAEIDTKHEEVAQLTQASMVGSSAAGLEGSNVEEKLTSAGGKLAELETEVGESFVTCDSIPFIGKFIKELYIIPTYPDKFNLSNVIRISVYRNSGTWRLDFHNEAGTPLSTFKVSTIDENKGIISGVANQTDDRFVFYAVVDWNAISDGAYFYAVPASVSNIALNIDYSPTIRQILEVKDIYRLPSFEYDGIVNASKDVNSKDRLIDGITLRFKNTTTGKVEIWVYQYYGDGRNYESNFCKKNNWSKVATLDDIESKADKTSLDEVSHALNSKVFVKCANTKVQRFFKELYIVPENESFDISVVKKVTLYRNDTNNHQWRVIFADAEDNILCYLSTTENIEDRTILVAGKNQTPNKFDAYIVPNWDELEVADAFYLIDCSLDKMVLSYDYSPSIKTYLTKDDIIYVIDGEYDSFYNAVNTVAVKKRKKGIIVKFFNSTSNSVVIAVYNYNGENPEYMSNFGKENNWTILTDSAKKEDVDVEGLTTYEGYSIVKPSDIKWEKNGIYYNTGLDFDSDDQIRNIGYIDVKTGISLYRILSSGNISYRGRIFLYNNNKEFIRNIGWNTAGSDMFTYLSEAHAKSVRYVRFCLVGSDAQNLVENPDVTGITFKIPTTEKHLITNSSAVPSFSSYPIAAHQGCSVGGYTKGSPRAYANAKRMGYEWIETDIQFSKDDVPVVLHDSPINYVADKVVYKATGLPVNKADNIKVNQLTFAEIKSTMRWADGGEIQSLDECFKQLADLNLRVNLEFKEAPRNQIEIDNVKNACVAFGLNNIIWSCGLPDAKSIFLVLREEEIFYQGGIFLTGGTENDVRELIKFCKMIGNCCWGVWQYGAWGFDAGPNSEFIQNLVKEYGVNRVIENPITDPSALAPVSFTADEYARVKDIYQNEEVVINTDTVNYTSKTVVHTFTLSKPTNVNVSMVADSSVGVCLSAKENDVFYGTANFAIILAAGTYTVKLIGDGMVSDLIVKY